MIIDFNRINQLSKFNKKYYMKIILGINTYHADSSACIIVDGKLIAAIEEERINRKKHFSGYPIESIKRMFANC